MDPSAWIEGFLHAAADHPLLAFGVLFCVSTWEFVFIAGVVVPSTGILLVAGSLIAGSALPLWPTLVSVVVGAIVGETLSYGIGWVFRGAFSKWSIHSRFSDKLSRARNLLNRHGAAAVMIGRFVPGVDCFVPTFAGAAGMPAAKFALLNVVSAIGWALLHVLPGLWLGTAFIAGGGRSGAQAILACGIILAAAYVLLQALLRILAAILRSREGGP